MLSVKQVILIALLAIAVVTAGTLAISVPVERASPHGIISLDSVDAREGVITIKLPEAQLALVANTKSMDPTLDGGDIIIAVDARSRPIRAGDIVVTEKLIVHRVTAVESNEKNEIFFITQGDNNAFSDGKIPLKDIKWLVAGILYGEKAGN